MKTQLFEFNERHNEKDMVDQDDLAQTETAWIPGKFDCCEVQEQKKKRKKVI